MEYFYIETYGCSANQNNSEILSGLLRQSGYQPTTNEKISDILIFNTCIVKGKTESKIKRRMQDLSNQYPKKLFIVAGCMPETDKKSILKNCPKAILLGINHTKDIVKLIKDHNENKLTSKKQDLYLTKNREEKILLPKISKNSLISIVQISEGCNGACSYCKTKLAKGELFSYSEDKILKSIESDLKNGAKEIWITSQDNASYGLDQNNNSKLPDLLKKILGLNHKFKLRLGMMDPNNLLPILEDMIEIYKDKKMFKFLHIPVQSASDNVLKEMNRKYKINEAETIIEKFKKEFPDSVIATDIITGFPTETEVDHKKNLEFIEKYRPDVLNLSKFSSHKKTPAGKLLTIDKEIINKRATGLMKLHRETAEKEKQKYKDRIIKVLVDKKTDIPNIYESRDNNYNIILINSKDRSIFGKNIDVNICAIGVHHMIGDIIQP